MSPGSRAEDVANMNDLLGLCAGRVLLFCSFPCNNIKFKKKNPNRLLHTPSQRQGNHEKQKDKKPSQNMNRKMKQVERRKNTHTLLFSLCLCFHGPLCPAVPRCKTVYRAARRRSAKNKKRTKDTDDNVNKKYVGPYFSMMYFHFDSARQKDDMHNILLFLFN